jgi:hypothetical protein
MEVTNTLAYYLIDIIEQHELDTNAGKQLSYAAADV